MESKIYASPTVGLLVKLGNKSQANKKYLAKMFSSTKLSTFINFINKIPNHLDCENYEFGAELTECQNKVKGDVFELFTIIWFKNFGGDRSLFVHDVKWAPRDQPGWDFIGTNKLGTPVTIQSKFVGNSSVVYGENSPLETFGFENIVGMVQDSTAPSKVLFTTASKVNARYKGYDRDNKMRVIDRKFIKKFTEGNLGFWKEINEVKDNLFGGS